MRRRDRGVGPFHMGRRPFFRLFASAAVLAGVGCGACGPSTSIISGGWELDDGASLSLVTIDQDSLPAVHVSGSTVLSGRLTLHPDGTCERALVVRDGEAPASEPVELTWPCTWTHERDEVTLTWGEGPGGSTLTPVGSTVAALDEGGRLRLLIDTGVRCITTPCPSGWPEVYRLDL